MPTARFPLSARLAVAGVALLIGLWLPGDALAQQDASFSGFQLNRSLPGARSLAMGGAFVALADDATSAFANPAGLTILERSEVSLEGRNWDIRSTYTDLGRIDGQPTGIGLDTRTGLVRRETESSQSGLSFASYVSASKTRRWAAGVFHHVLADYSSSFQSQGVFTDRRRANPQRTPIVRFGPYEFLTDLSIENTGGTFAYQLGNCVEYRRCLRLGVTLASYHLQVEAIEIVFRDPPGRGESSFTEELDGASTVGDDHELAASLGLLWEPSGRWKLGLAYRSGPEFAIDQRGLGGEGPAEFKLPDRFAVGVAFSPTPQLTFSFEVDRVEYSSLLQGNRLEAFTLDDGNEARLGVEYILFFGSPTEPHRLALMAGAWHDPDHRVAFTGEIGSSIDVFRRAYFPADGEDELHLTAGVGVNLGNLQFDLGADFSDAIDTVAVSTVYRF